MDGIGGIIIGNLFRINTDVLPKGYKGSGQGGIGPNLGYIITGIGHTVDKDWVTKIDAQTVILDDPTSEFGNIDYSSITININASKEKDAVTPSPSNTKGGKTGGKQTPNSIILHCTAGWGTAAETVSGVNGRGLSIHYAVDRKGDVVQGADENVVAYHANNKNPGSIGIEIGNIFDDVDYCRRNNR